MTTRDYIRNRRFFNRTVGLRQAIVEGIAFAAMMIVFVAVCAIA